MLPFQNMSGDPEQEYFGDGIAEDITTALSKLSQLFVIARNSSFTFKGRNVDVRDVSKNLGVRYRTDSGGYRRDYLRALAQRVEVDAQELRIMGAKSELLRTPRRRFKRKGDLELAERLYDLAAWLDRDDPVIPFNLGNVLDELGHEREAHADRN